MRWFTFCFFVSLAGLGRWGGGKPRALVVTFFDVGQGDAALIQFPNRSAWLVDAGGGFQDWDVGRDLVLELARAGVLSLDAAIVSHPDLDHVMGFRTLLDQIPVRELVLNRYFWSESHRTPLLQLISGKVAKGAGTNKLLDGTLAFEHGGATGHFFAPSVRSEKANEHSLVLELSYGGCRFLFTGDLEKDGERALAHSSLAGAYTVIKAAHHGSKTSSAESFLAAFRSQIFVISSGAANRYGHPHPTVLRRLRDVKSWVFRTDFHGAIRFEVLLEGRFRCFTAHGSCGTYQCS